MGFSSLIRANENDFDGVTNLKYFYMPPKNDSKYLVVTFSGFHGRENEGIPSVYNYVKPLSKIDCHRLFIMDSYDGVPCYYLGENGDLGYEMTVAALILKISSENNITTENIITCGSSKGGTAAIYFALKYNLGHTCVGGFQVRVGTYLKNVSSYTRERVLHKIMGDWGNESVKKLDDFYCEFFNSFEKSNTNIYIHAGDKDPHYLNHVVHFLKIMDTKNIHYNLDLKSYNDHSLVGKYYSEYILETLPSIMNTMVIKEIDLSIKKDELSIRVSVPKYLSENKDLEYAYYVYNTSSKYPIKKIMYTNKNMINVKLNQNGEYKVKVFLRLQTNKYSLLSDNIEMVI